jgi:tetratricopeptide (TPR) repeat protein
VARSVAVIAMVLLTTASVRAQSRDLDEARRRFEAGSAAFSKKDYARAELEFRAALDLTGDPVLNFNIAEAQALQGHYEDAVQSYRAYLTALPKADDRAEVEKRITEYEAKVKAGIGTRPVPRREAPPGPPPGRGPRWTWGWVTAGTAVALLAVGASMTALSKKSIGDANKLLDARDALGQPLSFADIKSRYDGHKSDAATYGKVGITMYALTAAATGVAIYLLATAGPDRKTERPQARLRLAPALSWRAAGLSAGLEF